MARTAGRRHRLWRALALVALTLTLILGLAIAALHLPGVQRALFDRVLAEVEARTGVRVVATSMRLSPFGLRLELTDVAAAAGEAEPFLTVDGIELEVAPGSLLRGPVVVRALVLRGPRFDGSRPLPRPPPAEDIDSPGAPIWQSLAIERLEVRRAAAAGIELPEALADSLGELALDGLDADGSLVDGRLRLGWRGGRLVARPPGRPVLELDVAGEVSGPAAGPLELERLTLDGQALSGRVSAWLGLEPEQPLSVELDLEAWPGRLLGVEDAGEPLRLAGSADLRAERGELSLTAPALSAELVRPWVEAELFAKAGLPGSRVGAGAELVYDGGAIDGEAELRWSRGGEELARASLAASRAAGAVAAHARITADLLPLAPGRRSFRGRLELPLERPSEGRLDGGLLMVELPDLERGLARLDRTWPGWLSEPLAGLAPGQIGGPLRAELRLDGRLDDPAARLDGEWRPAPGASVAFRAAGRPLVRRLEAAATISGLPLERFVEGATGLVSGAGTLRVAGQRLDGGLELSGEGLGRGERRLDRLTLAARLADRRIELDELTAEASGARLRAAGEIELAAHPSAELELELTGGLGPLTGAAGRLVLGSGRLQLELPRVELAGEVASFAATLPLGTLARLPGAEALGGLPLAAAAGPIEVEWAVPELDWAQVMVAEAGGDAPPRGPWRFGLAGRLVADPAAPADAEGRLELTGLAIEQEGHRITAAEPLVLALAAGELRLDPVRVEADDRSFELAGEARLRTGWTPERPPGELVDEARVALRTAAREPLAELALVASLQNGTIRLSLDAPLIAGGAGRLDAQAPLALATGGEGLLRLSWRLPEADWSGWLAAGSAEEPVVERLLLAVEGDLTIDPRRPGLAEGSLRLPSLEAEIGGQSVAAREPVALRVGDGRLTIESARLLASGAPLGLEGHVELDPEWRPGAPPAELVTELAVSGGGTVPAALLNPFLAGGAGEGTLLVEIELAGPPSEARGELRLAGEGAGFFFASPYSVEVVAPELVLRLAGGETRISGGARVNEGRLDVSGGTVADGGMALDLRLDDVRAVLDYGLLTLVDADLRLDLEPEGGGVLAGRVIVDRGQLTRPMRLDSLLLDQLLPADLLGTELDPLEAIRLDLTLETRQGVRVKNNLADLKVRWEPIAVRGNPVRPIIEGRLETDPGGLVYAYGQTVRLDSAAIVYQGLPEEVPILELETTTSLEDPSITRLAGDRLASFDRPGAASADGGATAQQAVTTGLAGFLGEQLTGSFGETLGGARIDIRPLPIFGETDPGARLTASRELSARATLAASVDLRNAERQTYLLDLHDEKAAARLSAQLFTNDLGAEGATLQQRLRFGGTEAQADGPRLRSLRFEPVPGVRRRALRRAAGYRRGDRLVEGAPFEIAVAVGEMLRRRGYPDARVRVVETPAERRSGVALMVRIAPGPRVDVRFDGESLPRPLRRAVAALYRGDFYEPTAIEEMRAEAVRAWRSLGYLEPVVEIDREVLSPGPPEQRLVTVRSQPGTRREIGPPRFSGLPADAAAELSALFDTQLRRAELAAGLPAAERRAVDGLAALGWPRASIAGRELSADGERVLVRIEPGERLRVAVLELVYASGPRTEVGEAGGIEAGDPARSDRLARAALAVERELRSAGYLDARVRLTLEPLPDGPPAARKAVFAVDRGPRYLLGETDFAGLGSTRPGWAARTAGLAAGEPLSPDELREARRRLWRTGLFSAVTSEVDLGAEGDARVRFEVTEQPRYRIGYGLRWESEEGSSLVLDLLDENVLGRNFDLGLRALRSDELEELRLSVTLPGVLGRKSRLELFGLVSDEEQLVEDGEILDQTRVVEGTVQLGWEFTTRTTGRVYVRYRDVRFTETFLVEDPFFGPIDPISIELRQPFLGLQYIFDGRDDRVSPRRGLFASLDLSYSDESLGGDIRYGRLFGQLHAFRPAGRLFGRGLTWAQSVRAGRAEAFGGQELLGDLLLRAGGEYSVRGYRRESLGPPELIGTLLPSVETNSLLVVNQELRFELWEPLSGLLFLDAGNVWIEDDLDFDLFTSLGLGLRAETPVGLMRLDVAWPLDRRDEVDPAVKVYFGLGHAF